MKILKLTIENLNSLRGRHEVDFAAPPLSNTGLFAIVGETGAGKTTLLDAITLALYGRIDRDPDKKGAGKEVMSWGTGSCFAEIEYTTASGTYRSRWERRRAHGKPTGRLQASERAIAKYDPTTGEWPYLETKLSEVDALAPKVIGLDYNRFTRSVMLTQGEFARFLKARDSERANLLESITGTGIYRELSIAAFERHKEAAAELEQVRQQIGQLLLLTEAERAAVNERLAALQAEAAQGKQKLHQLRTELGYYVEQTKLEKEIEQARTQLANVNQAIQEQAKEREQLAAAERIRPAAEEINALRELRKRIALIETELPGRKDSLVKLATAETEALATAATALAKLNKFEQSKKERTDKINQAADLETSRRGLQTQRSKLAAKQVELTQFQLQTEQEIVQLSKSQASLQASLKSIRAELTTRLGNEVKELEESQWSLLLANNIASTQVEISQQQNLLNALDATNKIQQLSKETELLSTRINQGNELLNDLKKSKEKTDKDLAHHQEIVEQLRMNQQFYAHQLALEPGKPCPLCGALEHPLLKDWKPPSDDGITRANQELTEAKNAQGAAQKAVQVHETKLATLNGQLLSQQSQLSEQQANFKANYASTPLPKNTSLAEVQKTIESKQDQKDKLLSLSERVEQTAANRSELQSDGKKLEELNKITKEKSSELNRLNKELAEVDNQVTQLTAQLTELLKGHTVAEARQKMITAEENCRKKEAAARQVATAATAQHLTAKTQLNTLQKNLANDQKIATQQATSLVKLVGKLGFTNLEMAAAAILPAPTEAAFREQFTRADQQLHSLNEKRKEQDAKLAELVKLTQSLAPETELKATLQAAEQEHSERDQTIGAALNQLAQDENNRKRAGSLTEQLPVLEKETIRWSQLNELIGQADGSKFSRFAQGLTLARLVQLANQQLARLSERYRIDRKAGEDLSLEIVDTYQADNRRPTMTLSGGESFLISLALALGLSDLAGGKTEIRSLFIDEGFGTLDSNSLDIVVSTLENLQASGKTIGLISHVPALRERIHHQIILEPRGDGFSGLRVE